MTITPRKIKQLNSEGTLSEVFQIGEGVIDPSAALDIKSTSKGMLPPRLTAIQVAAIPTPATGLMVFNTNSGLYEFYNGAAWVSVGSGIPGFGIIVDLTGVSKIVTGIAASGGGTVTGSFNITIVEGICTKLRIKANGVTTDSDIEFFTIAGELNDNLIYLAADVDCNTVPYHVDGEPWSIPSFGAPLVGNLLYYRMTNNGANASTYDIEMVLMGEV